MLRKPIIYIVTAILFCSSPILGQDNIGSEKEMVKQADKLFADAEFEKAMPIYSQLVSNYPDNYQYNYCYGICILKAGKVKPRAIPFLERAAEISITTDYVFYYLAKAYVYAQRFEEAKTAFKNFKDVVNEVEAEKYLINLEISNCDYAAMRLKEPEQGTIINKTEILKDQVIEKSNVDPACGKYVLLPSKYSSKNNIEPDQKYAFLASSGDVMYFTVTDDKGNKDIAKLERKGNGQWGKIEKLPQGINTPFNDCYPVCGTDKNTLYFSSAGHQGFGGLDIYKTTYDPVSGLWSNPENFGHPVNSVYDDYFYTISEKDESARFVSDRNSYPGVTTMYSISYKKDVHRAFIDITGSFLHNGEDDGSRAIIRVKRESDGEEVFATSSNPISGAYKIELPAYGEYRLSVEKQGFEPEVRGLSIIMGTPREFSQEIILKKEVQGNQRLFVNNYYSSDFENAHNNTTVRSGKKEKVVSPSSNQDDLNVSELPNDATETDDTVFQVEIVRPAGKEAKATTYEAPSELITSVETVNKTSADIVVDKKESTPALLAESKEGIVFKIQIGAFKVANSNTLKPLYLQRQIDDLQFVKRDDGMTVVLTGESRSFRGILSQLRIIKTRNCADAFPVAYYNGKEISVIAAKEWLKKQN